MDHSITINGTKNTWKDWHLIPCEMPVVAPPTERMILVTVAGRCGTVDLSHSLTGNPVFENREGSWDFYVENESWQSSNETNYDIVVRTSGHYAAEQIAQWLGLNAGQFQTVVLEDDPNFTYTGRVWVDEKIQWKNGHTVLTLNYSLYPYATVHWNDLWKWDDFCMVSTVRAEKSCSGRRRGADPATASQRCALSDHREHGKRVERRSDVSEIDSISRVCHGEKPGHSLRDQNMDTGLKHFSARQ